MEIILLLCLSCLPVFLSQFKLLWNQDSQTDSRAEGGRHGMGPAEQTSPSGPGSSRPPVGSGCSSEATSQEGVGARLDEDGDLDVERRPRAASDSEPAEPPRDKVHPTILTQEEDDPLADETRESSPQDVIRIGESRSARLPPVRHCSVDQGTGRLLMGSVCRPGPGCSGRVIRTGDTETELR